ncbi:uncharacterized protein LOC108670414 [Hyalella azteca]|uniref:Uncharacterized protein LOC108670414 n=1 Tax=Hyalella azteca TaxID=294128 RepID=A0A8B7NIB8_HYAAZ|nr:uncharacterized protein LOC108670414 [Hyalella azteca]
MAAVMFDCVHDCPIYASPLDNFFLPLNTSNPQAVIFVCAAEPGPLEMKSSTCAQAEAARSHSLVFQFMITSSPAINATGGMCLIVGFSSPNSGETSQISEQSNMRQPFCEKLIVERVEEEQRTKLLVKWQNRSSILSLDKPKHLSRSTADTPDEPKTGDEVVWLHPQAYNNFTVSYDCPPKLYSGLKGRDEDEISSKLGAQFEEAHGHGLLWTSVVVIAVVLIVICIILFVFIKPSIRNKWKDFSDDVSYPETVSVISSEGYRHGSDGALVFSAAALDGARLHMLNADRMKEPTIFPGSCSPRRYREAEEVSEPGSPEPRRLSRQHPQELCVSKLPLL